MGSSLTWGTRLYFPIVLYRQVKEMFGNLPEYRRARDTFWDIPVPKMTALGDSLWAPVRPASVALRRHPRKLDAGSAASLSMARSVCERFLFAFTTAAESG